MFASPRRREQAEGRLTPIGLLLQDMFSPDPLVQERDDEQEGAIASIPRPQGVAMSSSSTATRRKTTVGMMASAA